MDVEALPHVLAMLRAARRVLILLTPGFEESPWCLEETRAAAARLDAVLPVFVDRQANWDEAKLQSAFQRFRTDRDFHQLRIREPDLEAEIMSHWRQALDSVARVTHLTHNTKSRCTFPSPTYRTCSCSM